MSNNGNRRQAYAGKDTECTVEDLSPGQSYVFHLRACNRVGVSCWSRSKRWWKLLLRIRLYKRAVVVAGGPLVRAVPCPERVCAARHPPRAPGRPPPEALRRPHERPRAVERAPQQRLAHHGVPAADGQPRAPGAVPLAAHRLLVADHEPDQSGAPDDAVQARQPHGLGELVGVLGRAARAPALPGDELAQPCDPRQPRPAGAPLGDPGGALGLDGHGWRGRRRATGCPHGEARGVPRTRA